MKTTGTTHYRSLQTVYKLKLHLQQFYWVTLLITALDEIINNPQYELNETLKTNFQNKALDFATCTDFYPERFKYDCKEQTKNIQDIVNDLFKNYDKKKVILEPSFVCES